MIYEEFIMELNEQSKQVLKYANQIGKSLGASALDTQHLLYGLAKCGNSLAGSILASHNITAADIKKSFETRSESLRKVSRAFISFIRDPVSYPPKGRAFSEF